MVSYIWFQEKSIERLNIVQIVHGNKNFGLGDYVEMIKKESKIYYDEKNAARRINHIKFLKDLKKKRAKIREEESKKKLKYRDTSAQDDYIHNISKNLNWK